VKLLLVFAFVAVAFSFVPHEPFITEDLVSTINDNTVNWEAGMNHGSAVDGASLQQIKVLLGVLPGGPALQRKTFAVTSSALPDTFDAAVNWPQCATMKDIRDQSACGSCWAFAAVEAMSDRMCIFLNVNVSLSSADLAFCCSSCGFGCGGGFPTSAWNYWSETGIVEEGCWKYPFPSCDHHMPGSTNPCPSQEYSNKACPRQCDGTWMGPVWSSDLHVGKQVYSLSGESDIMNEIYKNGPVEATFTVYADFVTYKSGVYRHTSGSALGGHAVKIMGWGVENSEKYWLVANSWNPKWGDNGYFKILRGTDECGIEGQVNGGIPSN